MEAYYSMSALSEEFLAKVKEEVGRDLDAKYRNGQVEHGGELVMKPGMLEHAYEEALDLVVYLKAAMYQRDHGIKPNGRDPV